MSRWIKDESYSFKRHTRVISALALGLIHSGKCLFLDSRHRLPPGASRRKFNKTALRWCLLSTWRETHCTRRRMNANCIISLDANRLLILFVLSSQKCAGKSQRDVSGSLEGNAVTNATFSRFRQTKEKFLCTHPEPTQQRVSNRLLMNFQFIPSPSSPNWAILQQTFSFVFVRRLFSLRLSHGARFLFEGILFIRFCWRRFVHETNKRCHPLNGKPNRRLLFRGRLVTVLQCGGFINLYSDADTRHAGDENCWRISPPLPRAKDSRQHYRSRKFLGGANLFRLCAWVKRRANKNCFPRRLRVVARGDH